MKSLTNVHGVDWEEDKRIKSMSVPGGAVAHIFTQRYYKGLAIGPYTGPVTINKVDGADGDDNRIRSIKIVKRY